MLKLDLAAGQAVPGICHFGDSAPCAPAMRWSRSAPRYGEFTEHRQRRHGQRGRPGASPGDGGLTEPDPARRRNLARQLRRPAAQHARRGRRHQHRRHRLRHDRRTMTGSADHGLRDRGQRRLPPSRPISANGEIVWPYLGIQGEASAGRARPSSKSSRRADPREAGLEAGDVITGSTVEEIEPAQPAARHLLFDHEPGDTVDADRRSQRRDRTRSTSRSASAPTITAIAITLATRSRRSPSDPSPRGGGRPFGGRPRRFQYESSVASCVIESRGVPSTFRRDGATDDGRLDVDSAVGANAENVRILVVEDEPGIAGFVRRGLHLRGLRGRCRRRWPGRAASLCATARRICWCST